jgi:hypothetical protein
MAKKAKYAGNPNTKELHRLKRLTPSCHLPVSSVEFTSLAQAAAAGYYDRCGHCNAPKRKQ